MSGPYDWSGLESSFSAELIACFPVGATIWERDAFKECLRQIRGYEAATARKIAMLEQQISVACGFHGEDLVPALMKRNRELEQQLKDAQAHSEHWRNPETGYVECECCCKWALDYEALRKQLADAQAEGRRQGIQDAGMICIQDSIRYKRNCEHIVSSALNDAYIKIRALLESQNASPAPEKEK